VVTFTETTKSLVTIRGRAGVTVMPNVLLYATVGTVWNHTDYAGLHTFPACPTNCSVAAFSSTNFGWVSGGGVEWALWNSNWIARIEALYYIVSGSSPGGFQPGTVAQNSVWYWNNLGIAEGRIGLSYKF
jgi:opacity protein-like surface antigen